MPEPVQLPQVGIPPVSRDLSARAAVLADRVAALVEATCSPESGAPATVAFLRGWATAATTQRPLLDHAGPIDRLVAEYGLESAEQDLLLLAGLAEEHEGLAGTFRSLHPRGEPRPTAGLAALLLEQADGAGRAEVRRLLGSGQLTRHRLLTASGDMPLFERTLAPAERLWEALHGEDAWPPGIARVCVEAAPTGLAGWVNLLHVRRAVAALRSRAERTLIVTAPDDVGLSRCARLAEEAGRDLVGGYVAAGDECAVALVVAHAIVRDALPVLVLITPPQDNGVMPSRLDLDGIPGPVFVCATPGAFMPTGRRPVLSVPTGPVRHDDRRRAWRAALPDLGDTAATLAARHPLDPALVADVAADVRSQVSLGGLAGLREVSEVVRGRAGVILPPGVELYAPSVEWESLVLPTEPATLLRDAVARLQHAALVLEDWGFLDSARAAHGVRLMFTGQPGTGKSLAAEVIATAAGTDLLVVDVSQVMSKWVGETEKNLAAIFDAAERTQAVLLLDEADALFSRRTQVSDAQDRYVNLHTAYLLQRLDAFAGLVVLTTNLRQNIDAAFIRRMDFVVEFPLPDETDRLRLWRLHLPSRAALGDDFDLQVLARLYPIPGGWIRNAAVAAAFLAAAESASISRRHLVLAVRREYAKAVRPFPGEPTTAPASTEEP
jgi:hypothetical protein